jgi:AcrR family transcriptional regulator
LERGVDGFTIDEVVQLANVSPRTFFNYFDSKESAVIGVDQEAIRDAGQRLRDRPRGESPVIALRNVFLAADDLVMVAQNWATRVELVRRYPVLMPRHLAAIHELQTELVAAMAERLGKDPTADPYPTIVVAASIAAARSVMSWWHDNGQPGDMREHLEDVFRILSRGLKNPHPSSRT